MSTNYTTNSSSGKSKNRRNLLMSKQSGIVQFPDLYHFFYIQLCCWILFSLNPFWMFVVWMVFASMWLPSPLSDRIFGVVGYRSKEKMIWPYTRRIVAFVADAKSFWDHAIGKNPRKSMSENFGIIESGYSMSEKIVSSSSPNPTSISLFDAGPESLDIGWIGAKISLRHGRSPFQNGCAQKPLAVTAVNGFVFLYDMN